MRDLQNDRGSTYATWIHRDLIRKHQIRQSMSRKGDCWDNAVSESVFATIKKELVYRCKFADRETARGAIFEYVEVFYNRERDHSALGYLTPEEFERKAA